MLNSLIEGILLKFKFGFVGKMRVTLEEVCNRESSSYAQKDLEFLCGDYPIFGASGLIKYIDQYHQEKAYVAVVKDGAGVGRTMFLPEKSSIIGTLQYLIPKEEIEPKYLYYAVKSMHLEKYNTGATIPHIYFKDYKKEEFNLPTKKKQIEIISILEKIEKAISNKKKQAELLDCLIKSRFIELFGDCKNEVRIGDVISISRGASPRPISAFITDNEDGVNWIKIGDVSENSLYITKTEEKITREGAKKSRMVYAGDFILSNSMSFGRPYILGINGCVHDGWLIMSNFNDTFNEFYLYHAIRSDDIQYQFSGKVNGATVKNLNSDLVKNTYIKVPIMELQNQFAAFVEQTDKSKFISVDIITRLITKF
ncbi:MAG: restriction endonuclease subunit S [Erysipelotrichaceae bacterium]|nr:restriction endonuclease subunit S [Erysipelotrichaceae bacterium]